jgi:modulator of FtsH protease
MAELRHTMGLMPDSWSNFFATMGGAAAALTGLLFIAVSLRPRDIRGSSLMLGRARSAFYSFAGITLVALLALAGTASRWIGIAQFGVGVGVIVVSLPFTAAARREGLLNYRRATVYHAGLLFVAAGGLLRASGGNARDYSAVIGFGTVLLLAIALSNSWQLVLSHDPETGEGGS